MRHQVAGRHLNRTSSHRMALRRNLAASLFEHGTISTTRQKARFVRPFAEKLITLAKNGSLHARRRAIALLQNRNICKIVNGAPVRETAVITKLFSEIGPRFADRNGGYTRIINLPLRRIGDNGALVLLQLVDDKKSSISTKTSRKKSFDPAPETEDLPPRQSPEEITEIPEESTSTPDEISQTETGELDEPDTADTAPDDEESEAVDHISSKKKKKP